MFRRYERARRISTNASNEIFFRGSAPSQCDRPDVARRPLAPRRRPGKITPVSFAYGLARERGPAGPAWYEELPGAREPSGRVVQYALDVQNKAGARRVPPTPDVPAARGAAANGASGAECALLMQIIPK